MKTIYIGALPFRADEKFLIELTKDFGIEGLPEIHADWVNPTYEPYALVRVRDFESAVMNLDGKKFGPNHLRVHVWRKNG